MIRVLISIGDPAGIGPEISIKAVNEILDEKSDFVPILVGDESVLLEAIKFCPQRKLIRWNETIDKGSISFIDTKILKHQDFPVGINHKTAGKASFKYLETAWHMLQKNEGDCLVTAPISKTSWNLAGITYTGHTEALAAFSGEQTYMLMIAEALRVLLATTHIPLKNIWNYLSVEHLFLSTRTTANFVSKFFGIKNVRIGFCGLNPHAGESGNIGDEEKIIITPAIEKLIRDGFSVSGPFPADSIFKIAIKEHLFDLIISMYHDQALVVLKSFFSEKLVNVTVNNSGWIRTSPGHGTAFDIAWKNIADASSMKEAIKIALLM
ncbi:MAG: 4-hydroxythreonine-4-phosphate dehydrogenase PdxA, partial [Candidatus Ratteibacteria bacterium]